MNQTGAVIAHRDPGLVDVHVNATCLAAQVLVDRVPHDLEEQMLEGTRVGAADVHPGSESDGFDAFEDEEALGAVAHANPLSPGRLVDQSGRS